MFGTLVRKEIAETVLDLRFVLATLLCVVLIPLGTYVSREDYEQRLAAYQNEHEMYRQRHGTPVGPVTGEEETQGFRPPSILSIFASGLDPFLPDKVITSYTGLFRTVKVPGAGNVQSLLFGKADLLFNVTFIVSLAALIFTFNAISGERERGTLPLMIANALPRSRILLSKVVGRYIALLVPFVISILIALLILDASPDVSIGSSQLGPAFLVILLATGLFLLGMICLGVCISTFTRRPMSSIVLLFFVWAMFLVGVPKVSPMVAEILYPVESGSIVDLTKRMVRDDIEREFQTMEKETIDPRRDAEWNLVEEEARRMWEEITARVRNSGREPTRDDYKEVNKLMNDKGRELQAKYAPERARLVEACQMRIAGELKRIEEDYRNKRTVQFSVAMNLARLSPVSSYAYIVSGLCGTGVTEPDNFVRNAQRFQDQVEQVFYDKVPWCMDRQLGFAEGFNPWEPPAFPDMVYHYPSLAEALQTHWPDLLLLGLFDVLFFALAFMRFNKYDVR
jgi:ABC-type transport system involved in multi-copper enzyme maturation permease subunit